MAGSPANAVDLVWDLTCERLTLGGALVLRQEGELLCLLNQAPSFTLHILCAEAERPAAERLAGQVFGPSEFPHEIRWSLTPDQAGWPPASQRRSLGFSYFAFVRLLSLYRQHGLAPRLRWSAKTREQALELRSRFLGKLVGVHLRSVAPFLPEESNADGVLWNDFLTRHARPGVLEFILLGHDPLPAGLGPVPGVTRIVSLGVELGTQLALVSYLDGFLGMASGLCTAANLSATPHVIFKHPDHHAAEMQQELGAADHFPFADSRQRIWRRQVNAETLDEACALILS